MWVRDTRPMVGFSPARPFIDEGQVTEPSVSVPTPTSPRLAAIPAPVPELEPHALRSRPYGFLTSPPTALQPLVECADRAFAHSLRLVFASTTAPASRSRAMTDASRPVTFWASASEPAVVGSG